MADVRPGSWQCPRCTLMNVAGKRACAACELERPKPARTPGSLLASLSTPKGEFLERMPAHASLGFLKDVVENKTGIRDRQQRLLLGGPAGPDLVGQPDDALAPLVGAKASLDRGDDFLLSVVVLDGLAAGGGGRGATSMPWQCAACTVLNEREPLWCEMCRTQRDLGEHVARPVVVPAAAAAVAAVAAATAASGGDAGHFVAPTRAGAGAASSASGSRPGSDWEMVDNLSVQALSDGSGGGGGGGDDDDDDDDEKMPPPEMGRMCSNDSDAAWGATGPDQPMLDMGGWGDDDDCGGGGDDDGVEWCDDDDEDVALAAATVEAAAAAPGRVLSTPSYAQRGYQCLSTATLERLRDERAAEVAETLDLSPDEAGSLLQAAQWDSNAALQRWLAVGPAKARAEAGLAPSPPRPSPAQCGVCLEDIEVPRTGLSLGCGHAFCRDCWQGWLSAELDKGPLSVEARCPAHKCGTRVPCGVFAEVLGADTYAKYRGHVLDNFVTASRDLRFCPAAGCGTAAAASVPVVSVACTACGGAFCFGCGGAAHEPVTCEDAERWVKKTTDDGGSAVWIKGHCKMCPKCRVPIEKNQGCQHMTCRKCRHEFCWLCMGNWREHSGCSQFSEERKATDDEAARLRHELSRFAHYAERYDHHAKAIRFAREARSRAEARAGEVMEAHGRTLRATRFVVDAVSAVIRCHATLQWTYAYGFFQTEREAAGQVRPGSLALFRNSQEQLQEFTDKLHEMTELEAERLGENEMRVRVVEYTSLVEKYRTNVIAAIQSGYDESAEARPAAA